MVYIDCDHFIKNYNINVFKNNNCFNIKRKTQKQDATGHDPIKLCRQYLNKDINTKFIKDSKKIPFDKRILISEYIKKNSIYALGSASVEEIEKINILNASLLSMKRALNKLKYKPSIAYIDGLFIPKNLKINH